MPGTDLDLVRNDGTIVNPDTGEVLALADAPTILITTVLGRTKLAIFDALERLREVERVLGEEAIRRMDEEGEWTARAPGVKVSAPSPSAGTVHWDAELLRTILDDLVAEKKITKAAALRACKIETKYVPVVAGIAKLEKIPGISERLAVARSVTPPPARKVSVKVDAGAM